MAHSAQSAEHHAQAHHHVVPVSLLLKVFGALITLTIITVLTAQIDLGVFNVPLALAIAGTKAILVILIFMALKWDSPVNRMVATMGIVFVVIFLTFTLFDTLWRGDTSSTERETIMDRERRQEELRTREPSREALRVAPADFLTVPADTTAEAVSDTAAATANEGEADAAVAPAAH